MSRSRGGLTTKIHAVTDAKGPPIRLAEPKPKGFARWRGDEAARGHCQTKADQVEIVIPGCP